MKKYVSLFLLLLLFSSNLTFAALYPRITNITIGNGCKIYEVTIYNDMNTSNPNDDRAVTKIYVKDC